MSLRHNVVDRLLQKIKILEKRGANNQDCQIEEAGAHEETIEITNHKAREEVLGT